MQDRATKDTIPFKGLVDPALLSRLMQLFLSGAPSSWEASFFDEHLESRRARARRGTLSCEHEAAQTRVAFCGTWCRGAGLSVCGGGGKRRLQKKMIAVDLQKRRTA